MWLATSLHSTAAKSKIMQPIMQQCARAWRHQSRGTTAINTTLVRVCCPQAQVSMANSVTTGIGPQTRRTHTARLNTAVHLHWPACLSKCKYKSLVSTLLSAWRIPHKERMYERLAPTHASWYMQLCVRASGRHVSSLEGALPWLAGPRFSPLSLFPRPSTSSPIYGNFRSQANSW